MQDDEIKRGRNAMGRQVSSIRVRRIAVVRETRATGNSPNYKDMFEVSIPDTDTRTAEQWVRAIFEDAPRPVRWFLLLGWRGVLGLRLGPRTSPDHILGWPIVTREPDAVCLKLHSTLLKSQLPLNLRARRQFGAHASTTHGLWRARS